MKKRKHSTLQRFTSTFSCLILLIGTAISLIAGLGTISLIMIVFSLLGIVGPAIAEGGSFFDLIGNTFEIISEGIAGIFEFIGSLFDGFG